MNTIKKEDKASILIVNNQILIAQNLAAQLEELGYKALRPLTSGEEAMQVAEKERPDLVLVDIELGGLMDGIEVADHIRSSLGIPAIFMTPFADDQRLEGIKLPKSFGYLLKPIQERDLKIAIEMALYVAKVDAKRRKVEEELQLHSEIVKNLSEGVCLIRAGDGNIVYTNLRFDQLFGYNPGELLGKPVYILNAPGNETPEETAKEIISCLEDRGIWSGEVKNIKKDGTIFWCHASCSTFDFTPYGRVWMGVLEDITDRKQAEERQAIESDLLRESEELFRLAFHTSPDAIGITRASDGAYLDINEGFAAISGYSREELMGKTSLGINIWADPRDRQRLIDGLRANGKVVNLEAKFRLKDGREVPALMSASIFMLKGEPHIYSTTKVIEDLKKVEEALRKSEEKYRCFVETANEGLSAIDGSRRITYVNAKMAEMLGYAPQEMIGRLVDDLMISEELDDHHLKMATRRSGLREEYHRKWLRKDNTIIDTIINATPMLDAANRFCGSFAMITDITPRKQAEAEKERLQTQLQHAQKMEAVGTMAGGIAHDFNNLLQAINGYTQVMLLDKKANDTDYHKLKEILKASERAGQLVKQLLLFSRKAETERKSVDLNYEVEGAKRILERTIPKMIDIRLHLGSRLWKVNADPVQIEQVFLNLGSNAADAMPDGGKLVIETGNITLDQAYAQNHLDAKPGKYVILTVSDTGHGMEKEIIEHIFEPFFTTKEKGLGTGLGLASVYGIVQNHGGYINCYSELDQGTTFKIYLPAIEQVDVAFEEDLSAEYPMGSDETVLIVDDEAQLRDFTSQVLQRFGYQVMTASSGEEALEIYVREENEIDLVILDIGMPGIGGHRCLREILEIDPSAKIVITSGYAANGQLKKTLESGAAGFVGKPYQVSDLLKKLRAILEEKTEG